MTVDFLNGNLCNKLMKCITPANTGKHKPAGARSFWKVETELCEMVHHQGGHISNDTLTQNALKIATDAKELPKFNRGDGGWLYNFKSTHGLIKTPNL